MLSFVALTEAQLSISQMLSLVAFYLLIGTILAIFAPEQIEKRVGPKVRRTQPHKGEKRLPWPVYFIDYATKLWFLAAIFVVVEISTEIAEFGLYIGAPIFVYGFFLVPGVVFSLMAIVPTVYAVMFILIPKDEPPKFARHYESTVLGLLLLAMDISEAYLFSLFLPLFNYLLLWAQLFTILLVVSIISSVFVLWAVSRRKDPPIVRLILLFAFIAPYFLLAATGVFTLLSRFLLGLPL